VVEAGVAGADVIDREAHAERAHPAHRLVQQVVVRGDRVLGDLDHDALGVRVTQRGLELGGGDGVGRGVDRQVERLGDLVEPRQGDAHRVQVELDAEPHLPRLGERLLRRLRRVGGEARERLDTDRAAARELDDRLEDVRQLVAEHRRLDAARDAREPHAIGLVAAQLVADDRGEHGQEARVAVAQARVGLAVEAAQRPVEAAVGHPHWDADVGADPGRVGDRQPLGDRMALGV
jgi:hypothetical protein